MTILERFLKYISIDTTSSSDKNDTPSTNNQHQLAQLLVEELNDLNITNIHYDQEHCYIYATLKGEPSLPKIGFVAHLDTSEDAKGNNIKPNIIPNYDGGTIELNGTTLSPNKFPDLINHIGKTLITTDGTTLLGADDKAGIAEIMTMLEHFSSSKEKHGDIIVCFTPDEEIGLGTLHLNKDYFNPDLAYTVDGSSLGEFSYENFNAATANIQINGISSHCGTAKGQMINAIRIATIINSLLPQEEIPELTEQTEGFFHLEELSGNVTSAFMKYLIRDFDKKNFKHRKELLEAIVNSLNKKYGNTISLNIKDTYYNMYEVIKDEQIIIDTTLSAIKELNITPQIVPIRGGTDGTDISYSGIPCPNLGTGGHNFHSTSEYIALEDMEKTTEILISIINKFSKKNTKQKT